MKRESLDIWTVYERPSDFPDMYVARRFEITAGKAEPTTEFIAAKLLAPVRRAMQERGLYRLDRNPNDEPQVVECWL